MLKLVVCLLAGLSLSITARLQATPVLTPSPVDPGVLTITPLMQDISTTDIVISKTIYEIGEYDPNFTTLTLKISQDEKGRVVGTANLEASQAPTGGPAVTLPLDLPIVGKVKDGTFTLKGTKKIETGSGKDYKSRNIKLSLKADMMDDSGNYRFEPGNLNVAEIASTATYRMNVVIGGLGYKYNFIQDVAHRGDYLFHYELMTEIEALGMKQPKDGRLYKVWTPYGVTVVKGYSEVGLDSSTTILNLKGKKFKYTASMPYGYNQAPFAPVAAMSLKTGYGSTTEDWGWGFFNFDIFHGGTNP